MAAIFVLLLATRARYLFGFGKQAYAVANIEHVAYNTHIVTLRPKQRRLNPVAGQFIYLQLGIAREEHPFSVLGYDKDSGVIRVAFKELGRFTRRSAKLVPGKIVYIDGPYGKFTHEMTDKKRPSVVIAGGIGATPFLQSVTDGKVDVLFYSTKYEDNAPFDSFFADSLGDKYIHLVTNAEPISKHSRAGRFNGEIVQSYIKDPQRFNYFVCGPKPFMNAVRTALVSSGVSADQIHAEEFTF
jgi:3-phenylpropionate/trans-cinnamate dioxygenase ferredoxin reductase subunit